MNEGMEQLVDEVLELYMQKKEQLQEIQGELNELLSAIDDLVGKPDEMGSFDLEGNKLSATVVHKMNISYPDKKELFVVCSKSEEVGSCFRLEMKESGKEVEKLLKRKNVLDKETTEFVERLEAIRVAKKAKTSITVKPKGKKSTI